MNKDVRLPTLSLFYILPLSALPFLLDRIHSMVFLTPISELSMKMKSTCSLIFLILTLLTSAPLPALVKLKTLFKTEQDADIYVTMHYNKGSEYYNKGQWKRAADEFEKVVFYGSGCTAADAYYFLGVSFFQLGEYDFANHAFSNYLKTAEHPQYFEDTIQYKFCIAAYFKSGEKRRLFKVRYFPKWATAKTAALHIYDEIIVAIPNHELAAQSLYAKGSLLLSMEEYRESIDAYQTLIRRFPRHELTPQAYLNINKAYCEQSRLDFQNPDLLGLAELNARKFKEEFPRDERVELAEGYVRRIEEMYAKGLYDVGRFYQRIGAPAAAMIYYRSAIEEFPNTSIADCSRLRLESLAGEENDVVSIEQTTIAPANAPDEPLPFDAETLYKEVDPLETNNLLTDQ
jgi:tetratricopeptide (TPR) repeat protein